MGGRARLTVVGSGVHPGVTESVEARVGQLEGRWSRFRSDSEIALLNADPAAPVLVSADTIALLERARQAHELTGGLFDPFLADELVALGYDRTHTELLPPRQPVADALRWATPAVAAGPRAGREWPIDPAVPGIVRRRGPRFDPGGIGKGLAADLAAVTAGESAAEPGSDGALAAPSVTVELGGDVALAGPGPDGGRWIVEVADPLEPGRVLACLAVSGGGVATSSRLRRRWRGPAGDVHHLLDPRTGRPAHTDVAAATVNAGSAWWADVLAKTALLAGIDAGAELVERHGAHGLFLTDRGHLVPVGSPEILETDA
jgi:thiamine biosynthesis lipoprotein